MAGNSLDTDQDSGEPDLVSVCRDVRAGRREPDAFDTAFAEARVFAQRWEDRPGVLVSNIPGQGRWVLVFSSHERLVRRVGDVPWLSTTGADLLDQLPHGLGVLVDVGDDHRLPLLPQPRGRVRFGGAQLPPRPDSGRGGTRPFGRSSERSPRGN